MLPLTTHHFYPPFPSDVPVADLFSVSLHALQTSPPSVSESSKLFEACRNLGFFYLNLTGSELGEEILRSAEELHTLQQEFFALPHQAKDEFGRDKVDAFFSYRWTACPEGVEDVFGRPGRREMYSLRADDFLKIRSPLPRHAMISSAEPILSTFAKNCRQVVRLLLSILEAQLALPEGALLALHTSDAPSGDFIALQHRPSETYDSGLVTKGEHTDFGSITMLFNWLGGLQIRQQTDESDTVGDWLYAKPYPGSCICNIGDSLTILTKGMLKSNIHRVVPASGLQAGLPRYSLVYFAHPTDSVELKPVKGGLMDAITAPPVRVSAEDEKPITAAEWTSRRSLGDLRGVFTYKSGIELRDNDDAVAVVLNDHVQD